MKALTKQDLAQIESIENTYNSKSNFSLAFLFLPKKKRVAINTIYNFCSYLDDIVDSSNNNAERDIQYKRNRLNFWKQSVLDIYYNKKIPIQLEPLKFTIKTFQIPISQIEILFDGISRDLTQHKYDTIDEMLEYCYGVASIVGIICLNIFSDTSDTANKYAVSLGYALQITNIMRDVEDDFKRTYRYIPKELLDKYNYQEENLNNKIYNPQFIAIMKELSGLAESFYLKCNSYLLQLKNKKIMIASEIMKNIYFEIFNEINKINYDVLNNLKIRIPLIKKLRIAIKTILKTK